MKKTRFAYVSLIILLSIIPNTGILYDPILGIQLVSPANGSTGWPVSSIDFSWQQFKEVTKYEFALATNQDMTQIVKEAQVTTTSYFYDGTLDYNTNYFWRVMAVEPAPSDWSGTWLFQTEAAPPTPPLEPKGPLATLPNIVIPALIILGAAAAGLITWLLVTRRQKVK